MANIGRDAGPAHRQSLSAENFQEGVAPLYRFEK
jgi:hypothetical protein